MKKNYQLTGFRKLTTLEYNKNDSFYSSTFSFDDSFQKKVFSKDYQILFVMQVIVVSLYSGVFPEFVSSKSEIIKIEFDERCRHYDHLAKVSAKM